MQLFFDNFVNNVEYKDYKAHHLYIFAIELLSVIAFQAETESELVLPINETDLMKGF